jgi:hypothetical protein
MRGRSLTRSIYGVVMLAALRVRHHVDCSDNFMEQQQLRIRNGMVTFLEVVYSALSDEFCCYFSLGRWTASSSY